MEKNLIVKDPELDKYLNIVQPNSVTNARYDFSAAQENILTCIFDAIQGHMTKERPLQTDLFGRPWVRINASDVAKGNTKTYVLGELKKLRKKDVDFSYTKNDDGVADVHTGIINGHESVRGTNFVDVELSVSAFPYLLYWGKGVGGTIYSKITALTLKSKFSKRIYKLCKRWENKGGFAMSLDEFKEKLQIQGKLDRPAKLKEKVMDIAKKEIDQQGDISFNYSLHKIDGSRSFNHIKFKIFSLTGSKPNGTIVDSGWYMFLFRFFAHAYPHSKNNNAQLICDELAKDPEKLKTAHDRFAKMDDQLTSGEVKKTDIIPLTKHILKADYGITK